MLDLEHGILDFNGFSFGPESTLDDLEQSGPPVRAANSAFAGVVVAHGANIVQVDGSPFLPEFFFLNDHPSVVLLRPYIQYPDTMVEPTERQQLRFAACARWLTARLGNPHYRQAGLVKYTFPWGSICAEANLLPRDACNAGYIVLRYVR